MSALTHKLRELANSLDETDVADALREAIDEIDSLTKRVTDLEAALKFVEEQRDEYKRALARK